MENIKIKKHNDEAGSYATLLYKGNSAGHAQIAHDGKLAKSYHLQAFLNTYRYDERVKIEKRLLSFCQKLNN